MASYRPVVEVDKVTREVVKRHKRMGKAGMSSGKKPQSIYSNCKKRTLTTGKTYFRYEDEFDPWERFPPGSKYRPVCAIAGNRVRVFYDLKDAAEVMCVKPATLGSCICHGQKLHGIEWRYLNTKYPETVKDGTAWKK